MWAFAKLSITPGEELTDAMRMRAVATAGKFEPQGIAMLMWAFAKLAMNPGEALAGAMRTRAVATAGRFKPRSVTMLMWALARLSLPPGAELAEAMSARAVATAGRFDPRGVATLLWAFAAAAADPGPALGFVLLSFLYAGAFTSPAQLCQVHQCLACMDLAGFLRAAAPPPPRRAALAAPFRRAFESAPWTTSGLERAVRRRLSAMGVPWTGGAREPRTGYTLDLLLDRPGPGTSSWLHK